MNKIKEYWKNKDWWDACANFEFHKWYCGGCWKWINPKLHAEKYEWHIWRIPHEN